MLKPMFLAERQNSKATRHRMTGARLGAGGARGSDDGAQAHGNPRSSLTGRCARRKTGNGSKSRPEPASARNAKLTPALNTVGWRPLILSIRCRFVGFFYFLNHSIRF